MSDVDKSVKKRINQFCKKAVAQFPGTQSATILITLYHARVCSVNVKQKGLT